MIGKATGVSRRYCFNVASSILEKGFECDGKVRKAKVRFEDKNSNQVRGSPSVQESL